MTVFEVDPIQGVLNRDSSRPHYSDKAEVSPYGKSFNDSNISAEAMSTHFPFCSFGLKLHIFYSKSFKNRFGTGTKSKYEVVLIFEYNFYSIFHELIYTEFIHLWDIPRLTLHGHHWIPKWCLLMILNILKTRSILKTESK